MSEQLVAGLDLDTEHVGPKGAVECCAYTAFGRLSSKGLEIYELREKIFANLSQEFGTSKLTSAGLNFPFSVPVEFMDFCAQKARCPNFQSWQQYVEHLFSMDLQKFVSLAREFKQEPLRITDKQHRTTAVSPLHKTNSGMIDLTYLGMRNLAGLDPAKFCVVPFHDPVVGLCSILEVCPISTLAALKLSYVKPITTPGAGSTNKGGVGTSKTGNGGKDGEDGADQRDRRRKVVESMLELRETRRLSCRDHPELFISPEVSTACARSDHALKATVACYTTALWVTVPALFENPYESNDENVLLEGWTYVPRGV